MVTGNLLSHQAIPEAVQALAEALPLSRWQRSRTQLRLDGGFGTDDSLNWLLNRDFQLCAKGFSGKRAGIWGAQVPEWQELTAGRRWVALAPQQLHFCRPTRTIAVRWLTKKGKLKHALYVMTDQEMPLVAACQHYDLRGGAEVDLRNDKQGLLLTHRRKRAWHAQEMLVLLTDLAQNFLVAFRREALVGTPLEQYGAYRLIQEALNIPGKAVIEAGGLVELHLLDSHPLAKIMQEALDRFWKGAG